MAIAFVQQATGSANSVASYTVTLGSTPSSSNILLVTALRQQNGSGTGTITVSGAGATWTQDRHVDRGVGTIMMDVWRGTSPSSTVITITHNASNSRGAANASEWSGMTSTTDGINSANGFSTALVTGNITTTNANDLIYIAGGHGLDALTISGDPPTGYTQLTAVNNPDGNAHIVEDYRIVSATATYSGAWTISGSTDWIGIIIAYQASGAADFPLVASPGSYSISGIATTLLVNRMINAATGSYLISGVAANLDRGFFVAATAGSYLVTGVDAVLLADRLLAALTTSYSIIGFDTGFSLGFFISANGGTYNIAGTALTTLADRMLNAVAGVYAIQGVDATLIRTAVSTGSALAEGALFLNIGTGLHILIQR